MVIACNCKKSYNKEENQEDAKHNHPVGTAPVDSYVVEDAAYPRLAPPLFAAILPACQFYGPYFWKRCCWIPEPPQKRKDCHESKFYRDHNISNSVQYSAMRGQRNNNAIQISKLHMNHENHGDGCIKRNSLTWWTASLS